MGPGSKCYHHAGHSRQAAAGTLAGKMDGYDAVLMAFRKFVSRLELDLLWSFLTLSDLHLDFFKQQFFHSNELCGKPYGKLKRLPHSSQPASNDTILDRLCKVYAEKRNEEVMKVES